MQVDKVWIPWSMFNQLCLSRRNAGLLLQVWIEAFWLLASCVSVARLIELSPALKQPFDQQI